MNFKNTLILFLLIGVFSIHPINASPVVTNGGFETDDLTGWSFNVREGTDVVSSPFPSIWGDYTCRVYNDNNRMWQNINCSGHDLLSLDYYESSAGWIAADAFEFRNKDFGSIVSSVGFTGPYNTVNRFEFDISGYEGEYSICTFIFSLGGGKVYYFDNISVDNYIIPRATPESSIQFEDTPYKEYDTAVVNFSVEKIMHDYPDKRIYLEIATSKVTEPFYNYVAYELEDYTGYRGLEITGKSPVWDAYHNCSAYIRAYDQDMGDYETILEIEESVLSDNHTLINYTGYDYPTNKSYITGQNIGLLVDIMDYIETDFLGYPDELFTVWVKGFSNSNQGNTEQFFDLDAKYWNADRYFIKHIECAPFSVIDSGFNATVESYVSVYRNGNTTRLTPTIYTNMYASGYIPEGEEGYIPPDIPEEPEEPDTGENETLPENPDIPDIPTVTNQSINLTWVYYYYEGVNNSFDTLLAPVYNFTGYTLTPIYLLNDSISDYNYIMNESFTETTQKINILSGSFNIIYNSFHPKIVGLITYYLIWLVLLIILKKR
jgi:hypothetical protein